MSSDDSVQWVSTAWINALRAEVLRVGRQLPEVARVVGIGVWIATYTEKDGSNAFPSRQTLATLAGCSQETVTNAVKVLIGVGVLERKRRPNASAVYQLLMPLGRPLDWAAHIHHMTETRQRKAYAKKKAAGFAEARTATTDAVDNSRTATTDAVDNSRTASMDAVENPSDSDDGRVPDSVRVGGSEPPATDPDSVHGRPRKASVDAVRNATVDAPTKPTPTSGRDPHTDHNLAGLSPQPQTPAGEAAKSESSPGEGQAAKPRDAALAAVQVRAPLARCTECHIALPYGDTGICQGCEEYLNSERTSA